MNLKKWLTYKRLIQSEKRVAAYKHWIKQEQKEQKRLRRLL